MLELFIRDTLETSLLKQKPYSADLHASGDCIVVTEKEVRLAVKCIQEVWKSGIPALVPLTR